MNRIIYNCRGRRQLTNDDSQVLYTNERLGCGEDVTPVIEAVMADGQDHEIQCPKCSMRISVKKIPIGG